jgi:hypothetical protein
MEALRETTGGLFPAHTYLLDGTTLVAYIKKGETTPFYFKAGIKGFDKRGRKFERADSTQFKQLKKESNVITVQGSKGQTYFVDRDQATCTCPGFTFRGSCKHLAENG